MKTTDKQIIKKLTPEEAFQLIQQNSNNPDFIILDLRPPKKYIKAKIKNAINFDYNNENFDDNLEKLDKNKTYFIYCTFGLKSNITIELMEELSFREVYCINEGLIKWKNQGFEISYNTQ
ncbi:MAG: rhodanese-like domain-containing protein [Candidatus Cloacimonetes bacterium]|nr:rhodanese-like domain-containing protein [Candidatus Cloacimonadota bacterium]